MQQKDNAKNTFQFIAILGILMSIGFAGYYFGFLGFIYKVMLPQALNNFPLIILSIIFGIAAFFSPCSFTVLPAYVSHYITGSAQGSDKSPQRGGSVPRALYFGFIAALGILTVNVIVGLVIAALGSSAPFASDPRLDISLILVIRIAAGLIIAALGLATVLGKHVPVPILPELIGRIHFGKSIFLYGMLYNGAAIGCTGPILLGLMVYALSSGSFVTAFSAFLIFALTMGMLMILLTVSIALFQKRFVQSLRPYTPVVQKIAGYVMIVVGLTVAILTLEGNRLFVRMFFPYLK